MNQPIPGEPWGDLELARRAARGDPGAQHRLVERLFDRVRRTMSYLAGGGADAEDLAQAALLEILTSADSFRGGASLEYWADRVAVQTAAKQFTRNKRRRILKEKYPAPVAHEPGTVDSDVEHLRAKQRLAQLMARLSDKNRSALTLHYVLGYPIAEIAAMLSCPVNTVRGRLRQGRKHLKKLVKMDPLLRELIAGRSW